jgi:hypothetical protein
MKAIFDGKLYSIVEMENEMVTLESCDPRDHDGEAIIEVHLGDLRLTIDPTDDEVMDVSDLIHMVSQPYG